MRRGIEVLPVGDDGMAEAAKGVLVSEKVEGLRRDL